MADVAKLETWLKALRSGEYERGQGVLRTQEDQYCCLGVAAEECFTGIAWGEPRYHGDSYILDTPYGRCSTDLPDELAEELGLNEPVDEYTIPVLSGVASFIAGREITLNPYNHRRMSVLIDLNDAADFNFDQIALFMEITGWAKG